MFLSIFELFKIGIGPSSSHTMGPMLAANRFTEEIKQLDLGRAGHGTEYAISVRLLGSLAFTGKGHSSDKAIMLGLLGHQPDTIDPNDVDADIATLREHRRIFLSPNLVAKFDPETDLIFDYDAAALKHPNTMIFELRSEDSDWLLKRTYFSVGGGFLLSEEEFDAHDDAAVSPEIGHYPYPFCSAQQMLEMSEKSGLSIAEMKRTNELVHHDDQVLREGIFRLWRKMTECIDRGLSTEGELPGGLSVKRNAKAIKESLDSKQLKNRGMPHEAMDWLSAYAMAVNEENAAGGQVVTAPTNGAAGVIPSVLRYYLDHCDGDELGIETFLLTAAAIGGVIKHNASISGAECGCQAEVGSASAMAAAGLCAVLGGTTAQIENAAEIALEHHLGLTCDPVNGLVQIPCIERNGFGAIKAVGAASLALHGDGKHMMPLDNCVEAMRQTGLDMAAKYKETSLGGLAVNLPEC